MDQIESQGGKKKVNWTWLFISLYVLNFFVSESTDYLMLMSARIVYEKTKLILVIFQKYTDSITFEELYCDPFGTRLRTLQLTTWPEGRKREEQLPGH